MKLSNIAAGLCFLLGSAGAVDMSRYTQGAGVEAGFKTWLQQIYLATEDLTANHTFVDFFIYNNGTFAAGPMSGTGQQGILNLKYRLLPPTSNQVWSHVPNSTAVYNETSTTKTYSVNGTINKDLAGFVVNGTAVNNCSSQYYQSLFTIKKYTTNGQVDLAPWGYSLILYNDYALQPMNAPSTMACQSPAA